MLKPLEVVIGAPLAPYTQRQILLQCHRVICGDAQLLVDLFVNYDCDLDSSNLFERAVNSVVRVAQGLPGTAEHTGAELARESMLAGDALGCIIKLLETLGGWVDEKLGVGPAADAAAKARKLAAKASANNDENNEDGDGDGDEGNEGSSSVVGIERAKASKAEYQRAIALFNKKPKKGVALMQKIGRLGETPLEIAAFLRHTPDLDKTVIGDYLGERDEPMLSVMHAYVDAMDFTDQTLDEGIRKFLEGFRLPGESQKIDRLMEKFAERFCKQNPGEYKSADTAYVLAFSVIMLNTDAHNPQVKNKMTKEGFTRNNRGIDDGADLPREHLEDLYDRIVNNEIRMKDENPTLLAQKAEMNAKDGASSFNRTMKDMSNRLGMDVLSQMMFGATKRQQMVSLFLSPVWATSMTMCFVYRWTLAGSWRR
jgi:brefeldin A-inhibited guanine nucleotide-exchange protein